jgi:deoxyribonuclease-4
MPSPNLGAHLSLGTDPQRSLADAHAHGVQCAQIFVSSPGAWRRPVLPTGKVESLRRGREKTGIGPIFVHAVYLINLASDDARIAERSRESLELALKAAGRLGAQGVVTHLGSHGGRGYEAVAEQVARALRSIVDAAPAGVDLVLENSAGAGGILGSQLEELGDLIARAGGDYRLRIALDTAHLCAAGWDFATEHIAARLTERIGATFEPERLALIHANDSRTPCGSHVDRHACVGDGTIGVDGFRRLLEAPALTSVPWILETPDLDARLTAEQRFRSLRILRELAR